MRLVAEANPEDRELAGEPPDQRHTDAGVLGPPRAGRDQRAGYAQGPTSSSSSASLRRTIGSAPSWPRYWTRL